MLLFGFILLNLFVAPPGDCLCQKNEQVVFSFLTSKKKMVSVCSEKDDRYLVYRYGTAKNIELQYPAVLDETSWQKFELYSYFRGGGVENAGVDEKHLSFTNEGVTYVLFEDYQAIGNKVEIGIWVTSEQRATTLRGLLRSKIGDLSRIEGKVAKADF